MKILTPKELREQAEKMLRERTMPTLEELLQAVAEAREKYAEASRFLLENDKDLN